MSKVLLILADGLRSDALLTSGHPFVEELLRHSYHDTAAQTVFPSVTLPCHMSLFHSVTPDRHGILTNTYVPQVRPVQGLCEVLSLAKKNCAFFYSWEPLRDISRPLSLSYSSMISGKKISYDVANPYLTEECISYLTRVEPDFAFLYLGLTDKIGHGYGWMSDEYMAAVRSSLDMVEKAVRALSGEYTIVFTADHGGHDKTHGADIPEDMTIPVFFYRPEFGETELHDVSIIDLAPTMASLMGIEPDEDWEGKVLPIEGITE